MLLYACTAIYYKLIVHYVYSIDIKIPQCQICLLALPAAAACIQLHSLALGLHSTSMLLELPAAS